jgi:hypothetical protein
MSPEVCRRLGSILGRNWVYPEERSRVIAASIDARTWDDIPRVIRDLVDAIGRRGFREPKIQPTFADAPRSEEAQ